jgi:Uma2 family endonuclease
VIQKSAPKLVTAEDLPGLKVHDPYELVKGEIVQLSPAGGKHGRVAGRAHTLVLLHAHRRKLGIVVSSDTGYYVHRNPDSVRAPDVAFISKERLARFEADPGTFYPEAPDLAIEVVSPSDTFDYVVEKVEEYLSAGGKAVWVLIPRNETIVVFELGKPARTLHAKDTISGGDALPGFKARVSAFFTDKPKKK